MLFRSSTVGNRFTHEAKCSRRPVEKITIAPEISSANLIKFPDILNKQAQARAVYRKLCAKHNLQIREEDLEEVDASIKAEYNKLDKVFSNRSITPMGQHIVETEQSVYRNPFASMRELSDSLRGIEEEDGVTGLFPQDKQGSFKPGDDMSGKEPGLIGRAPLGPSTQKEQEIPAKNTQRPDGFSNKINMDWRKPRDAFSSETASSTTEKLSSD